MTILNNPMLKFWYGIILSRFVNFFSNIEPFPIRSIIPFSIEQLMQIGIIV